MLNISLHSSHQLNESVATIRSPEKMEEELEIEEL